MPSKILSIAFKSYKLSILWLKEWFSGESTCSKIMKTGVWILAPKYQS